MKYILVDTGFFKSKDKCYYLAYVLCKNTNNTFLQKCFITEETFNSIISLGDSILFKDITEYISIGLTDKGTYNIKITL